MYAPALKVVAVMGQAMVILGLVEISDGWGSSFCMFSCSPPKFFLILFTFFMLQTELSGVNIFSLKLLIFFFLNKL